MSAYYNEIDPKAAAWLRELIKAGHIAPGDVDERSIADVQPSDLKGYTQCHFFAGIGGWSYALRLAGWPDERPVWTGSCPCQPFSAAGKRGGTDDARHLWPEFYRLIGECRPSTVFGEQVASKDGLAWLDIVSADLERANYAIGAADMCAAGVGAPHIRQRLYFVADTTSKRRQGRLAAGNEIESRSGRLFSGGPSVHANNPVGWQDVEFIPCTDGKARPIEPGTFPLAYGIPHRVGLLRGYGNAIVPQVAAAFIEAYLETL
jgi:DNA (cytosine-5)-methyltransferase 1